MARRVQEQSEGADLVITDRMLEAAEVRQALEQTRAEVERFESRLKGFEERFVLYRVSLGEE